MHSIRNIVGFDQTGRHRWNTLFLNDPPGSPIVLQTEDNDEVNNSDNYRLLVAVANSEGTLQVHDVVHTAPTRTEAALVGSGAHADRGLCGTVESARRSTFWLQYGEY